MPPVVCNTIKYPSDSCFAAISSSINQRFADSHCVSTFVAFTILYGFSEFSVGSRNAKVFRSSQAVEYSLSGPLNLRSVEAFGQIFSDVATYLLRKSTLPAQLVMIGLLCVVWPSLAVTADRLDNQHFKAFPAFILAPQFSKSSSISLRQVLFLANNSFMTSQHSVMYLCIRCSAAALSSLL